MNGDNVDTLVKIGRLNAQLAALVSKREIVALQESDARIQKLHYEQLELTASMKKQAIYEQEAAINIQLDSLNTMLSKDRSEMGSVTPVKFGEGPSKKAASGSRVDGGIELEDEEDSDGTVGYGGLDVSSSSGGGSSDCDGGGKGR